MRVHAIQLQMSKRHSKSLSFFCYPEELAAVLEPVLVKSGMRWCIAEKRNDRYVFREASIPEAEKAKSRHVYACHPSMVKAGGLDSLANVVQVWVPVPEKGRLRMGEIGMLITESELSEEHRKLEEEIYRNARKALTKSFGRGVLGRNSKTGGEHFYNDILISERAARANADGTVLASLMGDGFVTFYAKSVDAGTNGGG